MMNLCYSLIRILELPISTWLVTRFYPDRRSESKAFWGMLLLFYSLYLSMLVSNYERNFLSNGLVLCESVILTGIHFGMRRSSFGKLLAWQFFYEASLALLHLPVLVATGILRHKNMYEANRGGRTLGELLYSLLILVFLFGILQKKKKSLSGVKELLIQHPRMLGAMGSLEWCMLTYCMYLGQPGFKPEILIINLTFILCAVLLLLYVLLQSIYDRKRSEFTLLRATQSLLKEQNATLRKEYERQQMERHDLKHQALRLWNALEKENVDEAKNQVQIWLTNLQRMERSTWTGLPFLDFLINYKKMEMDRRGIDFRLDAEVVQIPLTDEELSVVLGNLLDNALEAAGQCSEGKRWITLRLRSQGEIWLLSIANSISRIPAVLDGELMTTKQDQTAHGWGIKNVRQIVERYGGDFSFVYDQEHFRAEILFY